MVQQETLLHAMVETALHLAMTVMAVVVVAEEHQTTQEMLVMVELAAIPAEVAAVVVLARLVLAHRPVLEELAEMDLSVS